MEMLVDYEHKMAAHCETGTLTGLLNHAGLNITEPLVFGIAHGIFFGYLETKNFPFPTFIVRSRPGEIREKLSKYLDIKLDRYNPKLQNGKMEQLDAILAENKPVGAQVDFFYMEYLPEWLRVHMNVHFITIIGKKEDKYIISDSYHSKIAELHEKILSKARWAGGHMAPEGFLYKPISVDPNIDLTEPIKKGIKKACKNMLNLPVPFVGIKGIYKFAKKVETWPQITRDIDHLSHEVMKINILLEDQGTGGAGFRFMYATFLRQAAEIINNPTLNEMSEKIMQIGDNWRNISYFAAKIGKNRDLGADRLRELGDMIRKQGDAEKVFFKELKKVF